MILKIKRLNGNGLDLPKYETSGSAGMDLRVDLGGEGRTEVIKKGEIKLFKSGLAIALPVGYEAQIRSRSGMSLKHGIIILNSPGTIDSDYRGEICFITANLGSEDFIVEHGMRIAQMVIAKYEAAQLEEVEDLDATERGDGAFGSTGSK